MSCSDGGRKYISAAFAALVAALAVVAVASAQAPQYQGPDYAGPPSYGPFPTQPIGTSGSPTLCGRRAISLVRADIRGKRVKLSGLVGKALYGRKVQLQTNYGAKLSKFNAAGRVTASAKTGKFTAYIKKPSRRLYTTARYRAVVGAARSPKLKLPQFLSSRSAKSEAGMITVRGKVKRSVLGKRNKVTIKQLVCGKYRTVGSARPTAAGNYKIKFASSPLRGLAFFRAEARVLKRRGSKRYAIQYARALPIVVTDQTG